MSYATLNIRDLSFFAFTCLYPFCIYFIVVQGSRHFCLLPICRIAARMFFHLKKLDIYHTFCYEFKRASVMPERTCVQLIYLLSKKEEVFMFFSERSKDRSLIAHLKFCNIVDSEESNAEEISVWDCKFSIIPNLILHFTNTILNYKHFKSIASKRTYLEDKRRGKKTRFLVYRTSIK